ncbi:hypothetical protein ABXJ76_07800 [Methylobacter sp. G7]|uniref:hypothetical protein n=1 Tax=Methylobacter sp. G7 TaxID=3230117 RepID=UPI003D809340
MAILSGDIKLLKSDTMSDAPEGGGAITGELILSGESNNIFDDISTMDRVYGAVHMRKVFPAVQTQNTDRYFGSHVIISKLPGDGKIGVNLFNTGDYFDRRPSAKSRVENYRARGPLYSGFLWATQYVGSRAVTIFQREDAKIPGIGDVLELVSATASQTIKIVKLVESVQTFADGDNTFTRRILEIEISDVLTADFVGLQMTRLDTQLPPTVIYKTVVANAARYYSARPLAIPAALGALTVKTDSVYSQVVPSSQSELALVDVTAGSNAVPLIESGPSVTVSLGTGSTAIFSRYLGSPITPGSLSLTMNSIAFTDVAGTITRTSDGVAYGTVVYATGELRFNAPLSLNGWAISATFKPAAAPIRIADTTSVRVTAANRGYVWTINLNPPPQPGALSVSYRALNSWYELRDNASGGLIGEQGIGSGSVNYVTGSVTLTTAALPDADSDIIYAWAKPADFFNRSNIAPEKMVIKHQLGRSGFVASTLAITWNDGTARTATCNGTGLISGHATGQLNMGTGELLLSPVTLPLGGSTFTFNYNAPNEADMVKVTVSGSNPAGDLLTFDLTETDILPGSLKLHWSVSWVSLTGNGANSATAGEFAYDDGAGTLANNTRNAVIDYALGTITFDPTVAKTQKVAVYEDDGRRSLLSSQQ